MTNAIQPTGVPQDAMMDLIRASLDAASLRHSVIAGNIANARTPGYRAVDLDFGAAVRLAQARSAAAEASTDAAFPALDATGPTAAASCATPQDASFNGTAFVDVHGEMAHMTENALRYQALTQIAASRLRMLGSVIHDGRR